MSPCSFGIWNAQSCLLASLIIPLSQKLGTIRTIFLQTRFHENSRLNQTSQRVEKKKGGLNTVLYLNCIKIEKRKAEIFKSHKKTDNTYNTL